VSQNINIYKIPNFLKHKENLIHLIFKIPQTYLQNNSESISHTDWQITKNMKREYQEYFMTHIFKDFAKSFGSKYKFNKILCTSIWFQVYAKNDFHITHTHPQCNFSNVLYIELPNNNLITNIHDLNDNKIDINIEEGNIITFPSFYRHNSPKNTTDKSKIVISFNTDVEM